MNTKYDTHTLRWITRGCKCEEIGEYNGLLRCTYCKAFYSDYCYIRRILGDEKYMEYRRLLIETHNEERMEQGYK